MRLPPSCSPLAAAVLLLACSGGESAPPATTPPAPAVTTPTPPASAPSSPSATPQLAVPAGAAAAQQAPSFLSLPNLASYASGALLSRSHPAGAEMVLDEWADTSWSCTEAEETAEAVVELAARAEIRGVRLTFEDFWAVRLPETVVVDLGDSAQGPFTEIARVALPATLPDTPDGPLHLDTAVTGAQGRYVRVTLAGRRDREQTQGPFLSDLGIHGQLLGPAEPARAAGAWNGGWLLGRFRVVDQDGRHGCFADGTRADVVVDGRTVQLRWQPADGGRAVALLVPRPAGGFAGISQVWEADGSGGSPGNVEVEPLADEAFCDPAPAVSALEEQLVRDRRARVYGILFDFGLDVPRPESAAVLDELAALLTRHADWQVTIEGHTDGIGDDAANQALSDRRAAAVRAALASRGIVEARTTSAGYGESRPAASNDTAPGRAENRRVEIVLR